MCRLLVGKESTEKCVEGASPASDLAVADGEDERHILVVMASDLEVRSIEISGIAVAFNHEIEDADVFERVVANRSDSNAA